MKNIFPDYYDEFQCIKSKCKHNCCIGWEIDIDRKSAEYYMSTEGDFGEKLRRNIAVDDGQTHFVLRDNERCPFLNSENLCDIYIELGENRLCEICKEHPRFYNQYNGRIEAGLGLACEECARIILTKREAMHLKSDTADDDSDDFINARDTVIEILQSKGRIVQRTEKIAEMLGVSFEERNLCEWVDVFLSLECLDEKWREQLSALKRQMGTPDIRAFDEYMKDRESEYEQLLVYLAYRHILGEGKADEFIERVYFCILSYRLIFALGATAFEEKGSFSVEDQIELCRMFSAEIEYSDENIEIILDEISSLL